MRNSETIQNINIHNFGNYDHSEGCDEIGAARIGLTSCQATRGGTGSACCLVTCYCEHAQMKLLQ